MSNIVITLWLDFKDGQVPNLMSAPYDVGLHALPPVGTTLFIEGFPHNGETYDLDAEIIAHHATVNPHAGGRFPVAYGRHFAKVKVTEARKKKV